jgi:fructokinase
MIRIGIDLGGTKIAGIALLNDDAVLAECRLPTPRNDYQGTVDAICGMVTTLAGYAHGEPYSIGVGMPGSVSPLTGKVQNANSTWLNGRCFKHDLEHAMGQELRLANDANCLAMSEAHDGAGENFQTVFGVILGTGCGGGLVSGGHDRAGKHAICGEWGHNPLPWPHANEVPGPECWCGRKGCLETWLSGPGLSRDHLQATGQNASAEEIGRLAASGDATCLASLDRHLDRAARGLAHVVNIVDPDIIIIGGGLVALPGLVARLPDAIVPYVFADQVDIRVAAARHGPASGVRGAACLWAIDETDGVKS